MAVEIRETIVTPAKGGDVVQIHISDVPLEDASASLRLILTAKVGSYRAPALAQLQWEAMKIAGEALATLRKELGEDVQRTGRDMNPIRRGSKEDEL